MDGTDRVTLDARLVRTRGALTEALARLLLRAPFDDILVREITDEAKIGYATFYRHYAAKEDLLHELALVEARRLIRLCFPLVRGRHVKDSCHVLCVHIAENRNLWRALLLGNQSGILREAFVQQTLDLYGGDAKVSGWLPEELHIICAAGATIDVLIWWMKQASPSPIGEVVRILDDLINALAIRRLAPDEAE